MVKKNQAQTVLFATINVLWGSFSSLIRPRKSYGELVEKSISKTMIGKLNIKSMLLKQRTDFCFQALNFLIVQINTANKMRIDTKPSAA